MKAEILMGPHAGKIAEIIKVEMNAGARNGWFTVRLDDESKLLLAGEELREIGEAKK